MPEGCEDYFIKIDDFPAPSPEAEGLADVSHYLWIDEDEHRAMCDKDHNWGTEG